MYSFDLTKAPQDPTAEQTFEPIPDGLYDGSIAKAEVVTNSKGHKNVKVQIKLSNNRVVFDRLNFESENQTAKEIAAKKFQSIVYFGVDKPQAKFQTLEQIASYLSKVPVKIYYKNKGKDAAGYDRISITYKSGVEKVTKQAGAASSVY